MVSVDLLQEGKLITSLQPDAFPVNLGQLSQSFPELLKIIDSNGGDDVILELSKRNEVQIRSNAFQRPIQPGFNARIFTRNTPFRVDAHQDNPVIVTNFQVTNRLPAF